MVKRDIAKRLRKLEDLPRVRVYNFGDNRKSRPQFKGFPDIVVVGQGVVAFVEVKMVNTKDSFRKEQIEFKEALAPALQRNRKVFYYVASEVNIELIIAELIKNMSAK